MKNIIIKLSKFTSFWKGRASMRNSKNGGYIKEYLGIYSTLSKALPQTR